MALRATYFQTKLLMDPVGAPRVDLVGKPHFQQVFGFLSEPKNDQKWGFPTKSTLGTSYYLSFQTIYEYMDGSLCLTHEVLCKQNNNLHAKCALYY